MTPLTPFDQMTPAEQDALFDAMANDDSDEVARAHLVQGNPIYVSTPDTPKGHVVVDNVKTVSRPSQEL